MVRLEVAAEVGPAGLLHFVVQGWREGELAETDSMEATLAAETHAEQAYVPVRFQSRITELGIFELWCVSTVAQDRWKLEFNVREDAGAA